MWEEIKFRFFQAWVIGLSLAAGVLFFAALCRLWTRLAVWA